MKRLFLIRHGTTESPGGERFYGSTDLPLSKEGRRQAERLAARLSSVNVNMIFTSPLERALATTRTIAAKNKISFNIIEGLSEVDFGEWEGLSFEEIQARYPDESEKWLNDPWIFNFPGGESVPDFKARVIRSLQKNIGFEGDLVIISHGGTLRVLISYLGGIEENEIFRYPLDCAGITILELKGMKSNILVLNDTTHLE
jgi:alpha-ribazole phosphatase